MDLIPKPDQVVAAAGNVAHTLLYGGLADLRPMPRTLIDDGQVSFRNRSLGVEHWVDEVLPEAVRAVHEHSGGRPVHVVGWSLGGLFALLTAADRVDLRIAS